MKTIGLLGGMSWESTIPYYRIINEVVKERLGGLHSAKLVLYSVDFHEIERLKHSGAWDEAGQLLAKAACALQAAGANFIVLCSNTMHKVVPALENAVDIPLLHIADATAEEIKRERRPCNQQEAQKGRPARPQRSDEASRTLCRTSSL